MKRVFLFLFSGSVVIASSLFYCSSVQADEPSREGDWIVQRDEQLGIMVYTLEMIISPMAEARPALKHSLIPDDFDLRDGNAALFYLKAMGFLEQNNARDLLSESLKKMRKLAEEKGDDPNDVPPYSWLEMPLKQLPLVEVKQYLQLTSFQSRDLAEAARRRSFSLDRNVRQDPNPVGVLLPEIQIMRELARNQSLRCRVAIAEGRVEDALAILGQQYAMAKHLGTDEFLVSNLVGAAIASMAYRDALQLLQHPATPNLYWAFASLPNPIVEFRKSLAYERQFLFEQVNVLREVDDVPRNAGYWHSQFVNATTIVLAKIDSNRIGLPDSLTKKLADDKNQGLQRGAKPILQAQQEFVKALNGESVFIAVDIPFSSAQSPVRLFVRNKAELDQKKLFELLSRFRFTKPVDQGDYLCFSMIQSTESSSKIAISDSIMTSARPDLPIAMQSVEEFPVKILVLSPEYLWRTFRDLMPTIPIKFGGGPSTLLTEGMRWMAIGIDPSKLQLQAITQSMSSEVASATASHLPKLLEALASQLRLPKGGMEQLLPLVKPVVSGDRMTISINGLSELDQSVAFLSSATEQILGPLTHQIKMDRFKQIGLAIHNYENANKVLPPSKEGRDADGKSILSWRVHLLPYLGEVELYKQFRLKEPWNSEHNLTLLEKMPYIYKGAATGLEAYSDLKPGYTTFLAPVGDDTLFGGTKPVKFGDVRDGLSNTIWLVEVNAEYAKPWTSPDDYVLDVANPAIGLAEIAGDKPSFLGALGDGSVTKFPLSLPPKTLLHLFQKADGNVVTW